MGLIKFLLHGIIGAIVGILFAFFYVLRIWLPANARTIGLSIIIILPVVVIIFTILGLIFGGLVGFLFRLIFSLIKFLFKRR